LDGNKASSYTTKISRTGGTITVKDGKALCEDTAIVLESFNMPDTWDGRGFNSTAIPQTKFGVTRLTVPAGEKGFSKTVSVESPDVCKHTQVDFYVAPEYDAINGLHDDNGRYISGVIFKGTGKCDTTPPPVTPEEPKQASYKCEALKINKADRTNFSLTPTVSMTNATLKKVVYVVKSGDKTVDTITREDLKAVDYKQEQAGNYAVTATVTVIANDKEDIAKGDCAGSFEVAAVTPNTPVTPTKTVEVVQATTPVTLPNTGLGTSGIFATFLGVSALGTAFAYAKQRFFGRDL
jgi:LPXTG-motif cell wall-anchored protein